MFFFFFAFKSNFSFFDPESSPNSYIFQPFRCRLRSQKLLIIYKGADFLRKKKRFFFFCVCLHFFAYFCVCVFFVFCVTFFLRGPDAFSGMPWRPSGIFLHPGQLFTFSKSIKFQIKMLRCLLVCRSLPHHVGFFLILGPPPGGWVPAHFGDPPKMVHMPGTA